MMIQTREEKTIQDYRLRFRPSLLRHRYGILIRHFEGEEETLKLHYALTVKAAGQSTGALAEVLVEKEQVYIDNHAPQLLAEQFADAIGKCLYPVRLSVHADGRMESVTNEAEIRNRWQKAKPALEQYYKGAIADVVFNSMDAQLSSGRYITGNLKKDLFFAVYFQALYNNAGLGQARRTEFYFPFTAFGTPVFFSGAYLPEQEEAGDKTVICFKGTCADERSYRDIINKKILPSDPGGERAQGSLELHYKFYPDTHVIYAITGFVQLSDGVDSRSIVLELFHQPEEKEPQAIRKEQPNIVGEQQVVSRKPFWALFKK